MYYMVRLISRVMSSARADSKTGSAQELWRMSVRLPWNFIFPTVLMMRGKNYQSHSDKVGLIKSIIKSRKVFSSLGYIRKVMVAMNERTTNEKMNER